MAEMTATFEPTPEVRELLEGKPAEYIVVNPVAIEAEFEDGRVVRYPQEIRERVVRCRDCVHFRPPGKPDPARCSGVFAFVEPDPDGFCAWGERRGES